MFCKTAEVFNCKHTILRSDSQPNVSMSRGTINLRHPCHFVVMFCNIVLVDGNSVDPNIPMMLI